MLENYWKIQPATLITFCGQRMEQAGELSDVVPGISWSPKHYCYHGDHCCLHPSHILQLFSQPSLFLELLMFLHPDVAGCHLALLHLSPLPSSDGSPPQLCRVGLYLVPQDLGFDILHLLRCLPFWPRGFQPSILVTDVPGHYGSHIVMALHIRSACLYLTVCCYVLECLRCTVAQPASGVLPGVADLRPQAVGAVFQSSFSQLLVGFLNISHSLQFVDGTYHAEVCPSMMLPPAPPSPPLGGSAVWGIHLVVPHSGPSSWYAHGSLLFHPG